MTPAIKLAEKAKIAFNLHEYTHDASNSAFGLEAVEKLGLNQDQVFKTLVVRLEDNTLAVGIVPVSAKLSMKQIAKSLRHKKAEMAEAKEVEKTTGYVLGGVSPLAQRKRLKTVLDNSALNFATIFVSAGKRGLEIELSPKDLAQLTQADFFDIAQIR